MSADVYNADALRLRKITPAHLSELTRIAQRELGLPEDGKCGPATRAELNARMGDGLLAVYPGQPWTAAAAVEVALSLRGRGEEGANNHGPFIRELGGRDGDLWCALFAGHCWRVAHQRAGLAPPAWSFRRPGVAEPGARALVLAALAATGGNRFTDPAQCLPGDLALWKRDGGHHVALVWHPNSDGTVATVEGNVGPFPAVVRDMVHDTHHEPHFVGFARPPYL